MSSKQSREKIYVIIRLSPTEPGDITVDPVGVYNDPDEAMEWVEKLEKINANPMSEVFDVIDFELGDKPIVFDLMKKLWDKKMDETTDYLRELMEKGLVDQLVGEDGNFYYQLTPDGKKSLSRSKKLKKIKSLFEEGTKE